MTLDMPEVTEDEALEYMVFQLKLACCLFRAVADTPEVREEVLRLAKFECETFDVPAIMAFYDTIFAAYEKDRLND